MRTRIQFKFAAFITVLILVAMVATSLLILSAVSRNQTQSAENLLTQQNRSANALLLQYLSSGDNRNPATFFSTRGGEFASDLERITGVPVRIYSMEGESSGEVVEPLTDVQRDGLAHALDGRVALVTYRDSILYYAPLEVNQNQMGAVRLTYDRASDNEFYSQMRDQLIFIGLGVFVGTVSIGLMYFSRVTRSIRSLNLAVKSIEDGQYEVPTLRRLDELGDLSRGITSMGSRIQATLQEKDSERQKLVAAVTELNRLDAEQKELLVAVSHELKTPLTAIRSYVDLVDMYPDDQDLAQRMREVTDSETSRLYQMVQKVLRITEADNLAFEVDLTSVNVRQLVAEVVGTLSGNASTRGIAVSAVASPAAGANAGLSAGANEDPAAGSDATQISRISTLENPLAWADPELLRIIVSNLLDNAIKYNRPLGAVTYLIAQDNGEVVIEVTDQGLGIPADHYERVFDPFVTVDKSQSRATGGSGLGLSVAKKYAERMGGSLTLMRSDDTGSTFRLAVPRVPAFEAPKNT